MIEWDHVFYYAIYNPIHDSYVKCNQLSEVCYCISHQKRGNQLKRRSLIGLYIVQKITWYKWGLILFPTLEKIKIYIVQIEMCIIFNTKGPLPVH